VRIATIPGDKVYLPVGSRPLVVGDTIQALVNAVKGDSVSLLWDGQQLQARTEVPLEPGALIRFQVVEISQRMVQLKVAGFAVPASEEGLTATLVTLGFKPSPAGALVVQELLQAGLPVDRNNIESVISALENMGGSTPEDVKAAVAAHRAGLSGSRAALSLFGFFFRSGGVTRADLQQLMALLQGNAGAESGAPAPLNPPGQTATAQPPEETIGGPQAQAARPGTGAMLSEAAGDTPAGQRNDAGTTSGRAALEPSGLERAAEGRVGTEQSSIITVDLPDDIRTVLESLAGPGGKAEELRSGLQRFVKLLLRPLEQGAVAEEAKSEPGQGLREIISRVVSSFPLASLDDPTLDQTAAALLGLEAKLAALQAMTSGVGGLAQALPVPWSAFPEFTFEVDPDHGGEAGRKQLRACISLVTENLGKVAVEVLIVGRRIAAEVWVANEETRSLVFGSVQELHDSFRRIGYYLEPVGCRVSETEAPFWGQSITSLSGRPGWRKVDIRA